MFDEKDKNAPALGFKDKEKAEESIKNLEGRDPDYQRLAVKGLIGRAKRVLKLTKDKEKLQNINDAIEFFDKWLDNFGKVKHDNWSYLPLETIEIFLPLKEKYGIKDKAASGFLKAYSSAEGDYKKLRSVASGEDEPTWDIVRNKELKKLNKSAEDGGNKLWEDGKDGLPTDIHIKMILWAFSPDASKIKKNLSMYKEKLESSTSSHDDSDDSNKVSKRKSDGKSAGDESPKKKKK